MTQNATLEIAINAAVTAGNALLQHYGTGLHPQQKESLRDLVTEVDTLSEQEIINIIREKDPIHGILTEEQGFIGPKTDDYWVVDALDGTINFIHEIPLFCVSIAFIQNKKPIVGAIYNPLSEELYYGATGIGCFKNQISLKRNDCPLSQSLLAQAFSGKAYDPQNRLKEFETFGRLNDLSQGCLRTGSAAMNLAYVADGKLGGCFGKANKFWDIAAGLLFAELAGATISYTLVDTEKHLIDYIAAAPTCYQELKVHLDGLIRSQ